MYDQLSFGLKQSIHRLRVSARHRLLDTVQSVNFQNFHLARKDTVPGGGRVGGGFHPNHWQRKRGQRGGIAYRGAVSFTHQPTPYVPRKVDRPTSLCRRFVLLLSAPPFKR